MKWTGSAILRRPPCTAHNCSLRKIYPRNFFHSKHRGDDFEMAIIAANELTEAPTLGLDLDGVIDEAPRFFRLLTQIWPGRVVVVTLRDDKAQAEADLALHGVWYDEMVLVERLDAKAAVIVEKGISVYIDDQAETLKDVPEEISVMLFRNGGNFEDRRWIMSEETGRLI